MQIKADPVSAFIHESLPTDVKNSLARYEYSKREPPGLLPSVVRTLNRIVTGPSFYDARRFEKVPLRPETIKLGESAPRGQELTRFNRMLLEDSFPQELAKTRKWRAEEILNQIKLTREICAANTAGQLYFSMKSLMQDRGGLVTDLAQREYSEPALIPASPWLDTNLPDRPSLKVAGTKKFTWNPAATGAVSWWVLQTRTRRWLAHRNQAGQRAGNLAGHLAGRGRLDRHRPLRHGQSGKHFAARDQPGKVKNK